ncbi:MAG: hypothetical protein ACF8QF_07780 [Phycisphaerales bacterium]
MLAPHQHRRSVRRAIASAALCACVATVAQANWFAAISSASQYTAKFTKVPDFDQVRNGLPNTGNMYCVPTAGLNWAAYLAHHGYPGIPPGDENYLHWQLSPAAYSTVTTNLSIMGIVMGTDAFDGTNGAGGLAGLQAWMAPNILVLRYSFSSGASPSFDGIASWALTGAPVTAIVGWYGGTEPILTRNGGHAVSVVEVSRSGAARQLGFHDPANEQDDLGTQSPFLRQERAIEPRVVIADGQVRVMDKVVGYGSGYIDGYYVMVPLFGLSKSTDPTKLLIKKPLKFFYDPAPEIVEVLAPGGASILDVAIAPNLPHSFFSTASIGAQPAKIWMYDPVEARVVEVPIPVTDPERILFGRRGELYIQDGRTLRCFDLTQDPIEETASAALPAPCEALAYNDATDQALAFCDGSVIPFGEGLVPEAPEELPAEVILSGAISMAASPVTGDLYLTSDGSPGVYHLHPPDPGRADHLEATLIGVGELTRPTDLSVGDGDKVYVTSLGLRKVFTPQDGGGGAMDESDPFHNAPADPGERTARSRSNFDPETMTGPAFRNVLPPVSNDGVAPCFADLNDDNTVDGADLGVLLGAWASDGADLNGDGTTDGADLGLLLGAWGDCL